MLDQLSNGRNGRNGNAAPRSQTTESPGHGVRDAAPSAVQGENGNVAVDQRSTEGRGAPACPITVVVPTRNEADNVEPLARRLRTVLPEGAEIVFVDDSDDETPLAVKRLETDPDRTVRLVHRGPKEREGGLGGAVVEGLRVARGEWVCVMDGDLQHPPELVPLLLQRAREDDVDVVIASRYANGGSAGSFGWARALVSRGSNSAAHLFFPRRLRGVTDPMTGFFLVRRDALDPDALRPRGFKILLEILARTAGLRVTEVPFTFGLREAGESKASLSEGLIYLSQLLRLRIGELPWLFSRFTLVGASGLVVNMALFALLHVMGVHYLAAAILATQGSTVWLFVLNDRWVFGRRAFRRSTGSRVISYFLLNNATLLVRAPLLWLFVDSMGLDPLLANFLTLLALTVPRFLISDSWIWTEASRAGRALTRIYDIHGVVAVESDVALPELERFETLEPTVRPTIRVRIGTLNRSQSHLVNALAFTPDRKSVV